MEKQGNIAKEANRIILLPRPKTSEPNIGEIDRRLAYNQICEDLDNHLPFLLVKKFMMQVSKAFNYQGIGLDYVISKRD